jgi:hypothetical protein
VRNIVEPILTTIKSDEMTYEEKAVRYAEKYGISDGWYRKENILYYKVIYKDYYQDYTVLATVDLDTMTETRKIQGGNNI